MRPEMQMFWNLLGIGVCVFLSFAGVAIVIRAIRWDKVKYEYGSDDED